MYREGLLGAGSEEITKYTSSMTDDAEIFRETVLAMIIHVNELERLGVVPGEDASKIRSALINMAIEDKSPEAGEYEDVHEYIEARLMKELGPIGGWVGLGRSRNDHVATAIRLRLRKLVLIFASNVVRLRDSLLKRAIELRDNLIIGSTHKQPAQVTTLGHYLLGLDELSGDFLNLLLADYCIVNKSPLGAGALAGSVVNQDRAREAAELGFVGVVNNTVYATGSRYFMLSTASSVVSYMAELGRFLNNLQMWMMPQLYYVDMDPKYLATSSLMPHKRNPAAVEVMRARIGESMGHLMAMYSIIRPLEMGYELDLQEATRHLWAIMHMAIEAVSMLASMIDGLRVREEAVSRDLAAFPITAAEAAEKESLNSSVPFRSAHRAVAESVRKGEFHGPDPASIIKEKRSLGAPGSFDVDIKARLDQVENLKLMINSMLKAVSDVEDRAFRGEKVT